MKSSLNQKEGNIQYDSNFLGKKIAKYVIGACENCGMQDHKKKDCYERPRKIGAKYTNIISQPNYNIIQKSNNSENKNNDKKLKWDEINDTWKNYDSTEQIKILMEYQKIEEEKIKNALKSLEDSGEMSLESINKIEQQFLFLNKLNQNENENKTIPINDVNIIKSNSSLKEKNEFDELKEFIDNNNKNNNDVFLDIVSGPTQAELYKKRFNEKIKKLIDDKKQIIMSKYHVDIDKGNLEIPNTLKSINE